MTICSKCHKPCEYTQRWINLRGGKAVHVACVNVNGLKVEYTPDNKAA